MSIDMKPEFSDFSHRHESNCCGVSGSLCVGGTLASRCPFKRPLMALRALRNPKNFKAYRLQSNEWYENPNKK
eukprot:537095-Pelagomonas_calceolata.AAC.10